MAQFILVATGVSGSQFQKAMEVVNKSKGKLSLVPQQTANHGITSPGMSSTRPNNPGTEETYQNIRFEWQHDAADLGAEVIQALANK